jgi:hypothetical protein
MPLAQNDHTFLQKAVKRYIPPDALACQRACSDCPSSDEYSVLLPVSHPAYLESLMKLTERYNKLRNQPGSPYDYPHPLLAIPHKLNQGKRAPII